MLLTYFTVIVGYLNDGRTASSLEHYFRPIKKEAEALRKGTSKGIEVTSWIDSKPPCYCFCVSFRRISFRFSFCHPSLPVINHSFLTEHLLPISTAIAAQYGEGVTGKAVSTYFERAKKDSHWNVANSIEENGGANTKAPRKPRTPKSKKERVEGADESPTKKKTPLNKTQGGRVAKTPGSGRGRVAINYAEDENEDDNEDINLKGEHDEEAEDDMAIHANGNGHGMGNGDWSNSGDVYYDPEDEYGGVEA
jgi:hypothetical protein